jgi:hypothetical protein
MPRIVRVPGLKEPLTFPTGTPDYEIYAAVTDALFPVEELPPAPKPEAGFLGAFGEGITSLFKAPEAVSYLASPTGEARGELAKEAESPYRYQRFDEVESLGQAAQLGKEVVGQSLGFMAVPTAAAATATAVSGPFAPIAAPAAFLGAAGLQYLTETTARQAQEQEVKAAKGEATEAPDVTKVVASSAAQAGVDLIPFVTIFKPVGRLFGLAGRESAEKVAKETVETFEKEGFEAAAKKLSGLNPKQSLALGFGAGAAVEGVQEPLQTLLERWGAGLDLSSDDALKEYMEAAILGPILGGPFGAISTGIGNVQRGMSNKEFLDRLQAESQGKPISQEQLSKDWDRQKAEILKSVEPVSLVNEEGKPQKITPELLTSIGISPSAKALSVGNTTVPMETLLQKDTSDKTVQALFAGLFQRRMGQLSQEFKQRGNLMSQEERESKLAEYTQAAQSFKSVLTVASPQSAINSPTNLIVQPSPADPTKFVLFNPITNQLAKGKDGKERQYSTLQTAERALNKLIGVEVSAINKTVKAGAEPEKVEAEKKAEAKAQRAKEIAAAPDPFAGRTATVTAVPTPTPAATPETAAATPPKPRDVSTMEGPEGVIPDDPFPPADLEDISFRPTAEATPTPTTTAAPVIDATQRLEAKEDAELEAGILEDEQIAAQAAITPEVNQQLQEALTLARQAIEEGEGRTFFPEDVKEATEFVNGINSVYAGLESGTLPYARQSVENLVKSANNLKQNFQQRIADRDKFEAEQKARGPGEGFKLEEKPDLKLVKTEKTVETPGTDPIGFARHQALMSFDNRNSSDYSSPEEAIDFGLDNLNDTLTEYNVTDRSIREQAVETYRNEIARLKKEAAPTETKTTEKKPRKPRTKKIQTPSEVIHTPPPAKVSTSRADMVADQIAALDGSEGETGEFSDIAEGVRMMKDDAKIDAMFDLATRLKNAYDTAQGLRPGVSEADRNAAVNQINKIYDEIDAVQRVGEIPVTSEGVKAAMENNGNAKEAQKIASESRKDICE